MPNWCDNFVCVAHTDIEMLKKMEAGYNNSELFETFCPMPAHISNKEGIDEADKLVSKLASDPAIDWYFWRNLNWGTKWEATKFGEDAEIVGNELYLMFDTAWAPPHKVFEKWAALGFTIDCYSEETGNLIYYVWTNSATTDTTDISVVLLADNDELIDNVNFFMPNVVEHFNLFERQVERIAWLAEADNEE